MESGKFAPSPDTLQKLADVLAVKPYEFYMFESVSDCEKEATLISAIKNKKFLAMFYSIYKLLQYEKGFEN